MRFDRPHHTTLKLSVSESAYFKKMRRDAIASGFSPGTPVIDVSGAGPALVYAIGGTAPGFTWLTNSRKPYTKIFAFEVLRAEPPDKLRRAWVVTGTDESVKFVEILPRLGLDFPKGYVSVASAIRGDFPVRQTLWKPVVAGPAGASRNAEGDDAGGKQP